MARLQINPTDGAETLLSAMTEKQFLRPHHPLGNVLDQLAVQHGLCPVIVARAIAWLEFDRSMAIGRLRRSELSQLARSLHRFWRQTAVQLANTASAARRDEETRDSTGHPQQTAGCPQG